MALPFYQSRSQTSAILVSIIQYEPSRLITSWRWPVATWPILEASIFTIKSILKYSFNYFAFSLYFHKVALMSLQVMGLSQMFQYIQNLTLNVSSFAKIQANVNSGRGVTLIVKAMPSIVLYGKVLGLRVECTRIK